MSCRNELYHYDLSSQHQNNEDEYHFHKVVKLFKSYVPLDQLVLIKYFRETNVNVYVIDQYG